MKFKVNEIANDSLISTEFLPRNVSTPILQMSVDKVAHNVNYSLTHLQTKNQQLSVATTQERKIKIKLN
jgi:hypothetical protein